MAYHLLLVDDETEIVDWLGEMFREAPGLDLEIHSACSAKSATEILDKYKIDVVVSDIQMPGMSGIQLSQKIRQIWPTCKIILLTGHTDFGYIYESVQTTGVRYLLKTEKDEVILENVAEAIAEIDADLQDNEMLRVTREQTEKIMPLLQKEFFQDLLLGLYTPKQLNDKFFMEHHLLFHHDFSFGMIPGRYDQIPIAHSVESLNQLYHSVEYLSEKYFSPRFLSRCFMDRDVGLVWLLQLHPKQLTKSAEQSDQWKVALKGALEILQNAIARNLGFTMSFALCDSLFPLHEAKEHYRHLQTLIGYRIGLSHEMLIVDEMEPHIQCPTQEERRLTNAVNQLDRLRILDGYIESNRQEECFSLLRILAEPLRIVKSRNDVLALEIYYSIAAILLILIFH